MLPLQDRLRAHVRAALSTAFGLDEGMPVVVRRRGTDRVHLAFAQDAESEHRLALFLLGSVEVPPRGDEGASEADSR